MQVVHYPGLLRMKSTDFSGYHGFQMLSTGYAVMPPMLVELGTSALLTLGYEKLWLLNAAGLAPVLIIWISTIALQARYHAQLRAEAAPKIMQRLISTNWFRTVLWTAKTVLGLYLLFLLLL